MRPRANQISFRPKCVLSAPTTWYNHVGIVCGQPSCLQNQHDHDQQIENPLTQRLSHDRSWSYPQIHGSGIHTLLMLTKFFRNSIWSNLIWPISTCKKVCHSKSKTNTPPCDPMHYCTLVGRLQWVT